MFHIGKRLARPRVAVAAVAFAAALAAAVGGPAQSGAASQPATSRASVPPGFTDTVAFKMLKFPTAIAFSPDGRVFVAQKSGIIKVFASLSATTPTVFANLSKQVDDFGDRGLLGLTVDPQLGTAGHNNVYALYTYDAPPGQKAPVWHDTCPMPPGSDTDGCVATGTLVRIPVNADGSAGKSKALIQTQWCQQFSSHSIGHLAFGPDGDLYVTGGDGANFVDDIDIGNYGGTLPGTPTPVNPCGDPPGGIGIADSSPTAEGGSLRAQSARRPAGQPVLLNGALLRVNPATGAGVPGNPMYTNAGRNGNAARIVAYGFRNPFRFTFRPNTQEIWVADVGWNSWEEIDRVAGPSVQPTPNYGWPCYEGVGQNTPFSGLNMCQSLYADNAAPAIAPYDSYAHWETLGPADTCTRIKKSGSVISAIAFAAPNSNYPAAYHGALFFGDHSRNCIWVELAGANGLPSPGTAKTFVDDAAKPAPVDLETDPVSGDLFYVDIDNGTIHRITYTAP